MEHDFKIYLIGSKYRIEVDGVFYADVDSWVQANEEIEAFLENERKGGDAK